MKNLLIFVLVIALGTLLGCQQKETAVTTGSATGASSVTDPHAGSDPSAVGAIEAMSDAGSIDTADIRYDLPAGWMREAPSSSMRLDQATIPGPGGEGQLAVFFFGAGGGGGVDANLDRWASQVQQDTVPAKGSFEIDGYRISTIEVEGTLLPSGMAGGPAEAQPGSVLYGAVVEGAGGPWFFKATGPKGTMEPQKDAFLGMLRSVRANL
jgi:hypothetical protein